MQSIIHHYSLTYTEQSKPIIIGVLRGRALNLAYGELDGT